MAPLKPSRILRNHLRLSDPEKEDKWNRLTAFIDHVIRVNMDVSPTSPAAKLQTAGLYLSVQHVVNKYKDPKIFPANKRITDEQAVEDYIVHRVNALRKTAIQRIQRNNLRLQLEQQDSPSDEDEDERPTGVVHVRPCRKKAEKPSGYFDLADDSDDPSFVPFTEKSPPLRDTASTVVQRTEPSGYTSGPSGVAPTTSQTETRTPEPPPPEQDDDMDVDMDDVPAVPLPRTSKFKPGLVRKQPMFAPQPHAQPQPSQQSPSPPLPLREPSFAEPPHGQTSTFHSQNMYNPSQQVDELYIFLDAICRPSIAHLYSHLASHGYTMKNLLIISEWNREAIRSFFHGVRESVDKWGDENVQPIHWDILEHYTRELGIRQPAPGLR